MLKRHRILFIVSMIHQTLQKLKNLFNWQVAQKPPTCRNFCMLHCLSLDRYWEPRCLVLRIKDVQTHHLRPWLHLEPMAETFMMSVRESSSSRGSFWCRYIAPHHQVIKFQVSLKPKKFLQKIRSFFEIRMLDKNVSRHRRSFVARLRDRKDFNSPTADISNGYHSFPSLYIAKVDSLVWRFRYE